jgi:signal transduction histidine kinase
LPRLAPRGPSLWWQAGLLALALVGASAFAAWPLVRRIRKLTAAVQQSAADGYRTEVPHEGNDELAALARAFNAAGRSLRATIESLHEQERALREFLSNTTHDVMHPLSVLQGHLHNAREALEQSRQVDAATLHSCQEEAHFVASLVHNLTAAARLQSGVVPFDSRPVDLRKIVERAAARHRPMAESRGLLLEVGVPAEEVVVPGDLTLLEQAISNLVHNAVRHNTTGKHVAVLLEASTGDRTFALSVLDDGPGVSEGELARLCERRFRTATAWRSCPEGTGIGLAIVREVADRHGMALDLGLRPGGGFVATLRGGLVTTPSGPRKEPGTESTESRDEDSATR